MTSITRSTDDFTRGPVDPVVVRLVREAKAPTPKKLIPFLKMVSSCERQGKEVV